MYLARYYKVSGIKKRWKLPPTRHLAIPDYGGSVDSGIVTPPEDLFWCR